MHLTRVAALLFAAGSDVGLLIVSSAFVRKANGFGIPFAPNDVRCSRRVHLLPFVRRSAIVELFHTAFRFVRVVLDTRPPLAICGEIGSSREPSCRRRTRSVDGSNRAVGLLMPSYPLSATDTA